MHARPALPSVGATESTQRPSKAPESIALIGWLRQSLPETAIPDALDSLARTIRERTHQRPRRLQRALG